MRTHLGFAVSVLGLVCCAESASAACPSPPFTLTNGQAADATQVMANINAVVSCVNNAPVGSTNSVQTNAGGGSFGAVGPLTDGQIVIGATGAAPQAAALTAGPGITVTNGPGAVTITNTYASAGVPLISYKPPTSALFNVTNLGTAVGVSYNSGTKVFSAWRSDNGTSGSDRMGFIGKSVPSGSSWSASLGMFTTPFGRASVYYRTGLTLVENSTGKYRAA